MDLLIDGKIYNEEEIRKLISSNKTEIEAKPKDIIVCNGITFNRKSFFREDELLILDYFKKCPNIEINTYYIKKLLAYKRIILSNSQKDELYISDIRNISPRTLTVLRRMEEWGWISRVNYNSYALYE